MYRIKIYLPADRRRKGVLRVFRGPTQEYMMDAPCLGKADNGRAAKAGNPDRDPALPYGDTPAGEYAPAKYVRFAEPRPRIGEGWIPMTGISGQAGDAVRGGRTGLGIHAGRGDGRLVPTYGCLRMLDRDMAWLAKLVGGDEILIEVFEGEPGPYRREAV